MDLQQRYVSQKTKTKSKEEAEHLSQQIREEQREEDKEEERRGRCKVLTNETGWSDSFSSFNVSRWTAVSGATWSQTYFKSTQAKSGSTGLTLNMTKSGCPSGTYILPLAPPFVLIFTLFISSFVFLFSFLSFFIFIACGGSSQQSARVKTNQPYQYGVSKRHLTLVFIFHFILFICFILFYLYSL